MTISSAASSGSSNVPSTHMMNSAGITAAPLPPTTSAGAALAGKPGGSNDASLGVALCRSIVLKYIYLTYLFLVRLASLPSKVLKRLLSRSNGQQQPQPSQPQRSPSSSRASTVSLSSNSGTSLQDEDDKALATASDQYLRQYTHPNHTLRQHQLHSSPSSTDLYASTALSSSSSSSSNLLSGNGVGGTSMLRRSSRFKSKSHLEEIAQNSTLRNPLLPADRNSGDLDEESSSKQQHQQQPGDQSNNQALATGLSNNKQRQGLVSSSSSPTNSVARKSSVETVPTMTSFAADRGILTDDGASSSSLRGPAKASHARRLMMRMTGRPSAGLGRPNGGNGTATAMTNGSPAATNGATTTATRAYHGPKKKTLVLDLDETLIHSTSRGSRSPGFMVEVLVDHHACLYYVYKRPHVDYFLKKVSEWYKLVIFTASMAEYADPVIDWLDQNRTLFARRYFRQACQFKNGSYLKDLTIIEPDLSSVCLLDNSPLSYSLNKENGIPIDSWFNDPKDEALLDLLPFLDALRFTDDVRSILSLRTI
ncbi:Nuclear envelope morphology protein 1 [Actinomortierella ambigua]|nr:Nuclear envelope morphology protein 1 [Actinomortierella ambigua]